MPKTTENTPTPNTAFLTNSIEDVSSVPYRQYMSRKTTFDSGHRVMNERMKCFNLHGHTYLANLFFEFSNMEHIGYAIDFKEVKRVGVQWIQDHLDHGMILNPKDTISIKACKDLNTKLWLMSLNGDEYCNPTAENISKEIFLAMEILFKTIYEDKPHIGLKPHCIDLNETPNCAVQCYNHSISLIERKNFYNYRESQIREYALQKGRIEYDDRLC